MFFLFLTFSPPFPHPRLFIRLEGKCFTNHFTLKCHRMEQRESWTCPRSISTLECFRCSSPRGLGTKYKKQDVHAVCGGWIRQCLMPWALCGTIWQSRIHPEMWWCGGFGGNTSSQTSFLFSVPLRPFPCHGAAILVAGWMQLPTNCA